MEVEGNLEEIFSGNFKRPEVQLEIEGVRLWFLVDAGAGKTVVKDPVPHIRESKKKNTQQMELEIKQHCQKM